MQEMIECCLCKKLIKMSQSNNPYPVDTNSEHRCCNECNDTKVIPARLEQIFRKATS